MMRLGQSRRIAASPKKTRQLSEVSPLRRRDLLAGGLALPFVGRPFRMLLSGRLSRRTRPVPFEAASVRAWARELAQKPYKPPDNKLPDALKDLTYDRYRMIRFKPDQALWRNEGLPFQLQFFHRGFYYANRVDIFEVKDGLATPIAYSPDMFTFGDQPVPDVKNLGNLGFAGFRIHGPINRPDYFDEIGVFLGASYFRAVAKGLTYGLSARGLSLNTADPKGEEFPNFRSFWVERPAKGANSLVVHALLDSESAAAAYRFTIRPGRDHDLRHRGDAVSARADRADRARHAHQHVLLRAQRSRRRRRFPPRGARLRRPRDPERARRADLAPAQQPRRPSGQRLRRQQSARLRPDAAPARLPRLRGPGGALRAPPERLGRADRRLGRRRGASRRDPDHHRDQRQHRGVLAPARADAREERILLHLPHPLGRHRFPSRCRSRRWSRRASAPGRRRRAAVRDRFRRREPEGRAAGRHQGDGDVRQGQGAQRRDPSQSGDRRHACRASSSHPEARSRSSCAPSFSAATMRCRKCGWIDGRPEARARRACGGGRAVSPARGAAGDAGPVAARRARARRGLPIAPGSIAARRAFVFGVDARCSARSPPTRCIRCSRSAG